MSILLVSLALNTVLVGYVKTLRMQQGHCISEFTGLDHDKVVPYQVYTDYMHENRNISDALWDKLDSSPIVVALDQKYTESHGLKPSIPFPWDQSKGLYHVKAFHHIHCLKNVRRAYYDALENSPDVKPLISPRHIDHCLDTLRQDIMCFADDTPMPTINERHKIGNDQPRKCKDWDALVKWTQEPERQSCFKMIDEYRTVPNSLEEFAFCPEGSPHTNVMTKYFERWGHKDPFTKDSKKEGHGRL
ncbi:hypothetical protein GQ44DRAFT_615038 [Phaeosphaeriaceae sp. PMI808]|nr:hypothetical protein GQ44DRAFT_615038 [Phaeosphaeriaceae sp. PMI808]